MIEPSSNPKTARISLFPLPSSVFYPATHLPLHIFEPRYREMVADSVKNEQWIGMVLLKPDYEEQYFEKPDVVQIGCAGKIDHWESVEDGKFNILLLGLHRFKIIKEIDDKPYRQAEVELLPNINDQTLGKDQNIHLDHLIRRFQEYNRLLPEDNDLKIDLELKYRDSLGQVADQAAYQLDMNVSQKQSFLEELDVAHRLETIHSVLDLKIDILNRSKKFAANKKDVSMN